MYTTTIITMHYYHYHHALLPLITMHYYHLSTPDWQCIVVPYCALNNITHVKY